MRKLIGWGVAQAYRLARRRAVARVRQSGVILPIVFHAAKPEEVRKILGWLKAKGILDQCWLSFDDGWREFKETVKVLEEFRKPATLFIAPGESLRGDHWARGLSIAERRRLCQMDGESRYNEMTLKDRTLLSVDEIKEIARHPLVRVGNHTWSHMSCPDRPVAEVLDEIDRAQATLTDWCGSAPTEFAYPFGRGSAELDKEIRKRGLRPHYTRQGLVTEATLGFSRNMVYEGMSLAENLGRILMAWPKVGETK